MFALHVCESMSERDIMARERLFPTQAGTDAHIPPLFNRFAPTTVAMPTSIGIVPGKEGRMACNFLSCNRDQAYFLPPSPRDWLPKNRLVVRSIFALCTYEVMLKPTAHFFRPLWGFYLRRATAQL